jgi:addiction module RelE/StbE family toxin
MTIKKSSKFKTQFKKLPRHTVATFQEKLELYLQDPDAPALNNHQLKGKWQQYRSINITADYRLIFVDDDTEIRLVAIGTHSELYK